VFNAETVSAKSAALRMVFSLNPVIEATVWAVGLRLDLVKGFTELKVKFTLSSVPFFTISKSFLSPCFFRLLYILPSFFKKVEKFSSFSFNGETVSPLPHYRKKWQNLPLFHFGNKKPTHHPLFRLLPCGEGDNCRLRRKVSFFRHLI